MTTATSTNHSMRFSPDELLAGMLATVEGSGFPADQATLQTVFAKIAAEFPLLAPFNLSDDAVARAIAVLEGRKSLVRDGERYTLTTDGRAACVSSKRTLFNRDDREQLEGAAAIFSAA